MPTLAQLKAKWFIAMDGTAPDGVPWRRHSAGSSLAVSTDGNKVTLLIDGKNYMKVWYDAIVALHNVASAEVYHAGWRLEGVKTLGESTPSSDALECLNEADNHGVVVRVLLSDHMSGINFNQATSPWLLAHGILTMLDNRYPAAGSNHFKYAVMKRPGASMAVVGSLDISKSRWDDSRHLDQNAERNPTWGKPTHDVGVSLLGPAVADLEVTFVERWNDPRPANVFPAITSPVSTSGVVGTHSVQVLRTYGVAKDLAYSWSPQGEFTAWASYLNAIKKAAVYIYIEDQYFLPFNWPPAYEVPGTTRDTDLVYQLGEAMKRGVRVAVLTPSNAEDFGKGKSKYQRDVGVNYLSKVKADGAPGQVLLASLRNGVGDVYVHSKLMIVDDELLLIGSANFGQRSMTCDGELQLAVVDEGGLLPRDVRIALWQEHMSASVDLDDPVAAYDLLVASVANGAGNLKPYPTDSNAVYPATPTSKPPDPGHGGWMKYAFDPYYGPPGIR